ncbi:MAG TPA: DMT family transporter, partial [Rhizomicrobium sp.]
ENKRGIVSLLTACALFTVNDTLTKLAALSFPVGEVLFVRGLICLAVVGVCVVYAHQARWLRGAFTPMVLLRGALDAAVNITFVMALSHMRLADLIAINLASPLLLTMLSAFILKEPVGWRRWTAVFVGFAGMILIVKPSPASFNVWALAAFASAVGSAMRDLATRRIGASVPTLGISFTSMLAVTVAAPVVALAIGEDWRAPTLDYIGLVGGAAIVLSIGSTFAVSAFRNVDVIVVAPFRYSLLLWSGLAGYFIFGEVSDVLALAGALLIAGSGLYTLHRERVRHRALSAQAGIH